MTYTPQPTSSTGMVQNPNWPTLAVNVWPEDPSPTGAMYATGQVDLAPRTRSMTITRGRQYELDTDQAGTVQMMVDNRDGAVSGGANGFKPMNPCRVQATWSGTTYNLFTGYVERFPTQSGDPSLAWSEAECVDLISALSQRTLRSVVTETLLRMVPIPDYYYPLTDPGGGVAANISPQNQAAPPLTGLFNSAAVNALTGNSPGGLGYQGVIPNDGTTSFHCTLANNPQGDEGLVAQMGQGLNFSVKNPWTIALLFTETTSPTAANGSLPLVTFFDRAGNPTVSIHMNGGLVYCYYWDASGTPHATWNGISTAGGPYAVVAYYDGANLYINCGGGTAVISATITQEAAYMAVGFPWVAGTSRYWDGNVGAPSPWANNCDVWIQHVALWQSTGFSTSDFFSALHGFTGQNAHDRIHMIASWLGVTNTNLEATSNPLGPMAITPTVAMADALRQTALDDMGRLSVFADGALGLTNRNHLQQQPNPSVTLGSNTGAGEIPYTGGPKFDYDPTHVYNDVQVTQTGGALSRAVDSDSQASYFQRILQIQMNQQSATDTKYASQWLLGRYKQPSLRPEKVTLDPGSNPALWPTVLGTDLASLVQINHRTINGGTISILCLLDQIVHKITQDSWTVDWQLSPVFIRYWILGAMHTTIATTVAAGVSAVTLNPLSDASYNSAEASLGVGTTITLSPGTANAETMTIKSVVSNPTPRTTGYTSITVTFTANTAHSHAAGDYACDPLPGGTTNPTTLDSRTTLDTNTITAW